MIIANPLQGVYLLALGDETRNGVWFRTPLSKSSCSDIGAKSDMIEALHNYIEVEFKSIDPDRCEELVYGFRHDLTDPKFYLSFSRHNLRYSYDDVLKSMLAADCKEEFCRQLSDQLVFCERCGQRPILYNVIRDEDSMTHHLSGHKRESGIYVEEIKQMLLSKLEAGVSQTRAVGSETKNV